MPSDNLKDGTRYHRFQTILSLAPGFMTAVLVGVTAQFLADHYHSPAMLLALLLGLAFHFLSDKTSHTAIGIEFTAQTILRLGVALLGARVSLDSIIHLGPSAIMMVMGSMIITLLLSLVLGRLFGLSGQFALLTAGAVSVCGASAAIAIASVLPKHEKSERDLLFTVLAVTVLSTIAMIFYPMLVKLFGYDQRAAGIFLGGTIHDVAQVVGAGFSISPEVGETATLVKLMRVTMLAPIVIVISLAMRQTKPLNATTDDQTQLLRNSPPFLPSFVIGFILLGVLNSFGLIPHNFGEVANNASRWALLIAIAAVGMKTSLHRLFSIGLPAIVLIISETILLGGLIIFFLKFYNFEL